MAKKNSNYRAQNIEVLEGLEPVRKRPGMYIGGTEGPEGLHHLFKEILDNSIDEAMNGYADKIVVRLHSDSESITVEDNGRGVPVDVHPKFKKSALELIMTTLHAGGKFSDQNYQTAGGLHGVGASVVNALSEKLLAKVKRDGYEWEQEFSQGKATTKLKKGAKTKETGTMVFFTPDLEIFKSRKFSTDRIKKIVQEKAFLNRGLKIQYIDEVNNTDTSYCYPDGVVAYVKELIKVSSIEPIGGEYFQLEKQDGIKVEVGFCWTENTQEKIFSYVNGIHTSQGGSHEDGFKAGLAKALRNYISVHNLLPKSVKLTAEDLREGLLAVVSVMVPGSTSQLQFQGQTKDKLNNPEVAPQVDTLLRTLENSLNAKPKVAAQVVERIVLAARARVAARSASQAVSRKVGVSHRLNLPGKLADCSSTRPTNSEILIVEGDSAGGSAKQGRDRKTQAVLPLRGKVLNSISANDAKIRENKEILDLVSALGCGFGKDIRLDKLRYSKVVILTDADADGMHIASLLMAFFFKFMRPLIKAGHLFLGLSPLYKIKVLVGGKEEVHWVYSDDEKEKTLKSLGKKRERAQITRFKGLGEMNPKTLWETTLDPKHRNLLQIQVEDDFETSKVLERLMGKDSSARYDLIQEYAHRLELDI